MDFKLYAKAFAAGAVGALLGALGAVADGNLDWRKIAALAAGGFVAGFGTVYAIPNRAER